MSRAGTLLGWTVAAGAVWTVIWFDPLGARPDASRPSDAPITAPDAAVVQLDAATSVDAAIDALMPADAAPLVDAAPSAAPLYTITEALSDMAAAPLKFIGTGAWEGHFSIPACAYSNSRVIVVYEYCTFREPHALGLLIVSPTRGTLYVYAEAETETGISTAARDAYFSLRINVDTPDLSHPPSLAFSFAEISTWQARWERSTQGCALDIDSSEEACFDGAWLASARTFVSALTPTWSKVLKDLHTRAARDRRRR